MKPFTLNTVLNYRVQLEKMAQNRLLLAEKKRTEILVQLQEKQTLFQKLIRESAQRQSEGIEVVELIRYEERIEFVKNELAALQKVLAERDEAVRKERENTLQKSKERKVMEKLKEKQDAAWQFYLDKKEAAMLDEIAVIFHER